MKKKLFGGLTAKEARAARKSRPDIKELTSLLAPEMLEKTGLSPTQLIAKIMSGDPEIKELIRVSIEQQEGNTASPQEEADGTDDEKENTDTTQEEL